jgi:hypothetical protein
VPHVCTIGQQLAVCVLAFAIRRAGPAAELRRALDRGFSHRPERQRDEMWRAARGRARKYDFAGPPGY